MQPVDASPGMYPQGDALTGASLVMWHRARHEGAPRPLAPNEQYGERTN